MLGLLDPVRIILAGRGAGLIWGGASGGVKGGVFKGATDNSNPNGGSMGDNKRSAAVIIQRTPGAIRQLADLRGGVMAERR